MNLEIVQHEREGVVILDVNGRLTVGASATALRDYLRELAAAGKTNVVLNLGEVDYIDSTGLGSLVVA